jgi:hypothetical protein
MKKTRIKKTVRQTVWLNNEQNQTLERLAFMNGMNRPSILRWAMLEFARNNGIFPKGEPTRKASRRPNK